MKRPPFQDLPIPEREAPAGSALDYHQIPIDRTPLSDEPLVDVTTFGLSAESYYARMDGLNVPYYRPLPSAPRRVWLRRSVAERLAEIDAQLHPAGIELFLLDGYRPVECQRALWDYFLEHARRTLPNPTPEACRALAGKYCSDPSAFDSKDFRTWPIHTSGGAIDLTLRRREGGEWLYMGGVFDDPSAVSHTRFYETNSRSDSESDREAQKNRRTLYWAMHEGGFASFAYEWWHYDLGTQMWVMNRPAPAASKPPLRAYYGLAPEPEGD